MREVHSMHCRPMMRMTEVDKHLRTPLFPPFIARNEVGLRGGFHPENRDKKSGWLARTRRIRKDVPN